MYPLKTRTIEYKANDSNPDKNKNQKNMILNESKTNISYSIETQDHEKLYLMIEKKQKRFSILKEKIDLCKKNKKK